MSELVCERCGRELSLSFWILSSRSKAPRVCRGCRAISEQIAEEERLAAGSEQAARDHIDQALIAVAQLVRHRAKAAKLREREARMRDLEVPVQEKPSDGEGEGEGQ